MRLNQIWTVALATLASTASVAFADDIAVGIPSYGGTGCPAGSASVTLSPDAKSLSILFDSFTTEAGGMTGKSVDRKSCNIAIPVHVPQGYSLSVFQIDYRGFNALPQGARSQFNVEYFFAGFTGPRYTKSFWGPQNQDYLINNRLMAEAVIWTPCGKDVNLRTNTSMMTSTNANREQALSSVDSMDLTAGIVYQFQWRRCN
jgi:hypothetical protein